MSLDTLKEKIHSLETERNRLANEVEIMRKAAENRVVTLEEDIRQMHEESRTLRELLFSNEKIGITSPTSKPVIAPAVESAKPAPEAPPQTFVQEVASNPVVVSKSVVSPATDVTSQPSADLITQAAPEIHRGDLEPEKPEVKSEVSNQDDMFKTLSAEERKVVDVLCDHGGRYSRTNIRTEAGLSWLQSNRVISHLAERGIVGLEKSGASMEVVLKETS